MKTKEIADRIVKMLYDAGYDKEGALKVIKMAREKYKYMKTKEAFNKDFKTVEEIKQFAKYVNAHKNIFTKKQIQIAQQWI